MDENLKTKSTILWKRGTDGNLDQKGNNKFRSPYFENLFFFKNFAKFEMVIRCFFSNTLYLPLPMFTITLLVFYGPHEIML